MGHRNTLSGHIQEAWYVKGSDRAIEQLWHHNRRVLDSLPEDKDEVWPYLGKRMFSTSPVAGNMFFDGLTASYRGPVIHFRYRPLFVAALLAVAFLLVPTIVVACAIPPKPTVLEAYDDSDVVIIARAISVERLSEMAPSGTFVSSTTMEVKKVFKGDLSVGDKMRQEFTRRDQEVNREIILAAACPP